jgi:hypothetical protein
MDATAKRELSGLRRLSSMMCSVGRDTIILNQTFLSDSEIIRITNEDLKEVRRDDIQGEFDVIVDVATPEKNDETANTLGTILQTNAASLDPALSAKVLARIIKLKNEPDLAHQIENFKPEPDQQAVEEHKLIAEEYRMKNKLLEMQILEIAKRIENYDANIIEKLSRTQENSGDLDEKVSRAEYWRQQANKVRSETDILDKQYLTEEDEKFNEKRYQDQLDENKHDREIEKLNLSAMHATAARNIDSLNGKAKELESKINN